MTGGSGKLKILGRNKFRDGTIFPTSLKGRRNFTGKFWDEKTIIGFCRPLTVAGKWSAGSIKGRDGTGSHLGRVWTQNGRF